MTRSPTKKVDFAALDAATPASVLAASQQWISKGDYTLTVQNRARLDPAKDEATTEGLAAAPGQPKAVLPEKHARTPSSKVMSIAAKAFPKLHRFRI